MHRGYIKDWRKSLDHPLFKKPLIWHFWGYCLKKAQLQTFKLLRIYNNNSGFGSLGLFENIFQTFSNFSNYGVPLAFLFPVFRNVNIDLPTFGKHG